MTIFGIDISNHQPGFPLAKAKAQGFEMVSIKCTEGSPGGNNAYADPLYLGFLADAKAAGMLVTAYHVLHKGNAVSQADWFCSHIKDKSIPGHLDIEPFGDNPTSADARAFIKRCKTHGVKIGSDYFPKWYWLGLAVALRSMKGLPKLFASNYPIMGVHEYASALYGRAGGDKGPGWQRYGGRVPFVWQFTDNAKIDGYNGPVDADAFRGTRDQLAASGVYRDFAPKPPKPPTPQPQPQHEPNIDKARAALTEALKQHPKHGPVHRAVQAALDDLKGI